MDLTKMGVCVCVYKMKEKIDKGVDIERSDDSDGSRELRPLRDDRK